MRETEVLRQYNGLVVNVARRYFVPGMELQDLVQEGQIALVEACRRLTPGREETLGGLIYTCVSRRMVTLVKAARREGRQTSMDAVSLEQLGDEVAGSWQDLIGEEERDPGGGPEMSFFDRVMWRLWWASVRDQLTHLEREGLEGVMVGETMEEAAARLGVTVKALDNARRRARRKLVARLWE